MSNRRGAFVFDQSSVSAQQVLPPVMTKIHGRSVISLSAIDG